MEVEWLNKRRTEAMMSQEYWLLRKQGECLFWGQPVCQVVMLISHEQGKQNDCVS
jgi:hypothetical protein